MIEKEDVKALVKFLFDVDLTDKGIEIIKNIAYHKHNRIIICAHTRYGKSFCVSIAVLLYILFNGNKTINLIAPTYSQTGILRNYIAGFCASSPIMYDMLEVKKEKGFGSKLNKATRLQREISKQRITFKNGCELRVLSAEGEAKRLMGWGGDLTILDESCLIGFETYRTKISRMLGDRPDSMLVEIGNPWDRNNQMWLHWDGGDYHKIHINYKDGIKEGRVSKKHIEDQRKDLTPMEFKILYEAEFPEEAEDALIKWEWIQNAKNNDFELEKPEIVAGLDVAEMGMDLSVLTVAERQDKKFRVIAVYNWSKKDTIETINIVTPLIQKHNIKRLAVDAIGVGKGVYDNLRHAGFPVVEVKIGKSPVSKQDKERFSNLKAQYYWTLRDIFEDGLISIPDDESLKKELNLMKYKLVSGSGNRKKISIIDPSKSPDFADSLMMCVNVSAGFSYDFF